MSNPELLAMLTAHGIDPTKVSGGYGGINQMDVAGMLSGLDAREEALVRAKYAGGEIGNVMRFLWFDLIKEFGTPDRAGELAILVTKEFIEEPRCTRCKGVLGYMENDKWHDCPACEGRGYKLTSDRQFASYLGLKRLQEPWKSRVDTARKILLTWEAQALAKFR